MTHKSLLNILIVDDTTLNIDILVNMLEDDYDLTVAKEGEKALEQIAINKPDLLLLDIMMPNMSGFEVCTRLKSVEETKYIPIIFITAMQNINDKVKGLELGAEDYITKPFHTVEVKARIHAVLRSKQLEYSLQNEIELRIGIEKKLIEHQENLEQLIQQRTLELSIACQKAIAGNKAKSVFLSTIGHELRTPLNIIIGYCDLLLEELQDSCKQHEEDIRKINQAGIHLLTLISDILDYANVDEGNVKLSMNIFNFVDSVEQMLIKVNKVLVKNKDKIVLQTEHKKIEVNLDQEKVNKIIYNLLDNAVKFTHQGKVTLQLQQLDDTVVFTVSDTGIGISKEKAAIIFQPFRQVDEAFSRHYEGCGLGLAICQQYCKLMHGNISVVSEETKGATFIVTLPLQYP